jgi:type IV secretory pathway ATPase VirB11/archaellum biosynthesis ATPase
MRENKLTTPPARLRAALRFKQGGKRIPAIENSPSAFDSFAAKIAHREGKSVESDNPAYIAVLQAEIERKKVLLKREGLSFT